MKFVVLLILGFLSSLPSLTWAGRNESKRTLVTGTVIFERKNTKACAEDNCPPSRPYYQASLVKAHVPGIGPIKKINILDLTSQFDLKSKPQFLIYKGQKIREGMRISADSYVQVTVYDLTKKTYAHLLNAGTVKILK